MNGCGHPGPPALRACPEFARGARDEGVARFTGRGAEREYLCSVCEANRLTATVEVCPACAWTLTHRTSVQVEGAPGMIERADSGLEYREERLSLDEPPPAPIIEVRVAREAGGAWIALCEDGQVGRLDLVARAFRPLARVPAWTALGDGFRFEISADARFAAVRPGEGRPGVVLDLARGVETLVLERAPDPSFGFPFAMAFVKRAERTLLVHATAWGRLDASDAQTGELLTARPDPPPSLLYTPLLVSPDGSWLASDAWTTGSSGGLTVVFSLARWLDGNMSEPDGGSGLREIAWEGAGGRPMVWVDAETLGVWGTPGEEGDVFAPVLRRMRADRDDELAPIACPLNDTLAAEDGRLYAFGRIDGLSVIDLGTGDRLLHRPDVRPTAYRGGGELLTMHPDGCFSTGRISVRAA